MIILCYSHENYGFTNHPARATDICHDNLIQFIHFYLTVCVVTPAQHSDNSINIINRYAKLKFKPIDERSTCFGLR